MKLNRTLRDCVYGMAVGDALGVPFEFKPRGSFECTDMVGGGSHNQLAGTWSDDTSMALALCDSYRELGRVDCDDILRRFRAWINDGAYTADGVAFDYGNATRKALATGRGGAGEWDKGNERVAHALLAHGLHGLHECRGARSERHHARDRCLHGCVRENDSLRRALDARGHACG